jgi:O-antigen/teichoic acid export membrane protein
MTTREISPAALDLTGFDAVQGVLPAPRRLSLRLNFAWAFFGNAAFAACQWGMIVALAKFGNSFMVGQFSLGLAIVTPVLMAANLDLRAVQATDAHRQYRFSAYLRLRIRLTLAALAAIGAIAWFGRYHRGTAAVILAVALAKGVETLSDIHYGLFQLNDRLDQTGRSMILRGVLSVAAMSCAIYLIHSVFWACIWVALAWAAALLLFDVRRGRLLVASTEVPRAPERGSALGLARLLSIAWPLGMVTTLAAINLNMPRYFVHAQMGERQLGIFSAMAYATVALTLVGDSLANSAIPRLSRLYAGGELAAYRTLIFRLLAIGCVIGLSALAIARGCGAWLLRMIYNADYAAHAQVFALLVAAAALHFAASMLTAGITSARCFRIQVPLYLLVAGATAWGCARWSPSLGLTGAALGVVCGGAVRLLLAGAVLSYLLLPKSSEAGAA